MLVENRTKRPASHFAPLALFLAASAQFVGCDEPEDADEVVTLGEIEGPTDGKSDEIDARAINWKKTGEGELSEGKTDVRATIASVTDDVVVIESDLYIIRPTNLADVKISVDGSLISDIAFMMMYREDSDAEWNALEIVSRDGAVTVRVNGEEVNRGENSTARRGAICLQSEGAPIEYRNVTIEEAD